MNELIKWAVNLTVALLACALMRFIMPQGNTKKGADIALSLIVLSVMLSVIPAVRGADFPITEFEQFSYSQGDTPYNSVIEKAITDIIDCAGIEYSALKVNGETDAQGEFVIYSIEVTIDTDDEEEFLTLMKERLSLEREVFKINDG